MTLPRTNSQADGAEPLVSILIPAYNAEKWIRQCIESALGQTYPRKEVIVIDDGSTDRTIEEIQRFGDRISFVKSAHAGANAVRNQLTRLAKGEWLQYLDADDYLRPNKVADQIGFMRSCDRQLDVVYSPMIVRHETIQTEYATTITPPYDTNLQFLRWVSFSTHGILLRRSAVLEVGCWREAQLVCQEHELISRLIRSGKRFGVWNQAAAVYRYHSPDTVSTKAPLRTMQVRMGITNDFETWLKDMGGLTTAHRKEIYMARMDTARIAWTIDEAYGRELAQIAAKEGHFWIWSRAAVPISFQIVARIFGFHAAQRLARFIRGPKSATRSGGRRTHPAQ